LKTTTNQAGQPGTPSAIGRTWLWALFAAALLVRVVYVLAQRENPHFDQPIMDAAYHVEWARAFARGEDFQPGPFFRAPLYVWFLGVLQKVAGASLLVPRLVQCAFGALGSVLVALLGREVFDRRVGLVAGFLHAFYWVAIYFDGELLIPTLIVPLNLGGLLLSVRAARSDKRSAASALGAGLLFGLSAIARPNILLFMPVCALWLVYVRRTRGVQWLAPAALLTAGVVAPIVPITVYNRFVGQDSVLISSQAGVNFWIGNNPQSDGSTAIVPGTRGGWWEGYHDAIALAETAEGRSLRPSEVSQHYAGRAWQWIAAEPGAALRLLAFKARLFWTRWELGNNQEVRFFAQRFAPFMAWLPVSFAWLAPLGLLGLVLCLRPRNPALPVAAFVLVYFLGVIAFFVCARFRLPAIVVLIVPAAHSLVWLLDGIRARAWPRVGAALALVALFASLVNTVPAGVRTSDANGLMQLGNAHLRQGEWDAAYEALWSAVDADPRNVYAHVSLAHVELRQGRPEDARRTLLAAYAVDPGRPEVLEALFEAHWQARDLDAVERLAGETTQRFPELAVGWYHAGRLAVQRGDSEAAPALLARAESADPNDFRAPFALGMLATEAQEYVVAREALERALENGASAEDEFLERAATVLIQLYSQDQATTGAACRVARRFLELRPQHPKARELQRLHCGE